MIKCEKIFPSVHKETQGMQHLDYLPLHKDALPTQNHQRKKDRSQFPLPKRQTTQKCTFSKRFFDGDVLYFTACFRFSGHRGSHSVTSLS